MAGGNVIGNAEEADETGVARYEMSSGMVNTPMETENSPDKGKKKVTMHTRRGHKKQALMKEAEKATNESLSRIAEGNEDASDDRMN